ncbi:MAG: flippase-like domain-containing protein [Flavobacteriales bacterium]|nr:flippase-like domain-containing protein [Flavobacteriales bacterium]
MQDMRHLVLHRSVWNKVLRWMVFALACAFLWSKLSDVQGTFAWGEHVRVTNGSAWLVLFVLALAWLNWGLEALKWRHLVARVVRISYSRAFRATLTGTTIGLVTPNRTGEFLGRVSQLEPGQRTPAAVIGTLGGLAQLGVTVVAGLLGLVVMLGRGVPLPVDIQAIPLLAWEVALLVAILGAVFLFTVGPAVWRSVLTSKRIASGLAVLREVDAELCLTIASLSFLRYLVFLLQFVLLLLAFDTGIPWHMALSCVPVIFLVTTIIPTAVLTELGVRGSVAAAFLAPLAGDLIQVLMASFVLWVINLALPALAGGVLLLGGDQRRVALA